MNEEKGRAEQSFEWSTILSDDEFYPQLLQRKIRPAKWSGKDMPLLAEMRALMFEEPAGAPVRQVQEGFSPQRDTSH